MRKLSVALALTGGPPILLMVRKSRYVRKGKSPTHFVTPVGVSSIRSSHLNLGSY